MNTREDLDGPEKFDAALRTLNRVQSPYNLADRVQLRLKNVSGATRPRRLLLPWQPLLLSPLALAVVVLACITVARQAAPWRPVAPRAVRIQAPGRTLTVPVSAAALPRPGGRHAVPAQPQPSSTAHAQPTVPFVYPQSREIQIRLQSASEARITDRTLFDPRSGVEVSAHAAPR